MPKLSDQIIILENKLCKLEDRVSDARSHLSTVLYDFNRGTYEEIDVCRAAEDYAIAFRELNAEYGAEDNDD